MDDLVLKLQIVKDRDKLTLEKLSHKMGVSFTTIHRWLKGKTAPSSLGKLCIERYLEGK